MADTATAATDLDARFRAVASELAGLSLPELRVRCQTWRDMLHAIEAKRLAAHLEAGASAGDTARLGRLEGKVSKGEADRRLRRAEAVRANPTLADAVADGDLGIEQLDTIAKAMDTDPAAANDADLFAEVAATSVDQGRRAGREWANERIDAQQLQTEHNRQRRRREAFQYNAKRDGMATITLRGDDATIYQTWAAIEAEAHKLYQADGGRDIPPLEHPRTRTQRLFDAAAQLITTGSLSASRNTQTTTVLVLRLADLKSATTAGNEPMLGPANTAEPAPLQAELVGHGPIADSAAINLLRQSKLFALVTDFDAKPLWLGRASRYANANQRLALIIRDKGCVLCGTSWQHCEAHHRIPWTATARGETDIDKLALVCGRCHHELHDNKLTLIHHHTTNTWTTRPATPNEIAAPPPQTKRKRRKPNRPPPNTKTQHSPNAATSLAG